MRTMRKMTIEKLVYLVALLLLLLNHGTRGTQSPKAKEEHRRLRNLSIKSIETKYGGIYDCVNFYKQPAFDHPLLKNHTFHPQMMPSYSQERIKATASNEKTLQCHLRKLEFGGCPTGTVPIRRVHKDDWIQMKSFTKDYIWRTNPNSIQLQPGQHVGQYHCFNTLCPGFVSINKDIPIDTEIAGGSKRGGRQGAIGLFVYQDAENKNWWLELCGTIIGFWPHQIFTAMQDAATYVAVGGEAYGPPGQPLPPMGNGYYPSEELLLTAYCRNFTILDANRQYVNPQQTEKYAPEWRYGVYDMGIYKDRGRTICYGGTTL
ncbi:uncharacterized protein LOC104898741 isoform X2 [Beta vulgaris subsp. vulgaris]|uniref:uncharacterized protein LOC104898741 isoform X2 n=1 Tax=Beta vulgaris subsp. vulgaris TaxID=3555 RepID=UPI0020374976|nr:uncharacterized protein LOC104898741 isoform X2 [Beta vulgaris subsp. vulgaris]